MLVITMPSHVAMLYNNIIARYKITKRKSSKDEEGEEKKKKQVAILTSIQLPDGTKIRRDKDLEKLRQIAQRYKIPLQVEAIISSS